MAPTICRKPLGRRHRRFLLVALKLVAHAEVQQRADVVRVPADCNECGADLWVELAVQ